MGVEGSGLEEQIKESLTAGLEEILPGKGTPAHPAGQRRLDVIRAMRQRQERFDPGIDPILERFLSGALDFDEAEAELAFAWRPDEAKAVLFQIWIAARHGIELEMCEKLLAYVKDPSDWRTAHIPKTLIRPGEWIPDAEQAAIVSYAQRLARWAGIVPGEEGLSLEFSGLVRFVEEQLDDQDWDSIGQRLNGTNSSAIKLGLFALFAAPGEHQLEPDQLVELGRRVIGAMGDPFQEAPLLDGDQIGPRLSGILSAQFNEPIPAEVLSAALLGQEAEPSLALANLAVVGGSALSEALFFALPAEGSTEAELHRLVLDKILRLVWQFANELEEAASGRPPLLWRPQEISLYSPRVLTGEDALSEIPELAQSWRFGQLVIMGGEGGTLFLLDERLPFGQEDAQTKIEDALKEAVASARSGSVLVRTESRGEAPILIVKPAAAGLEEGPAPVLERVPMGYFAADLDEWLREHWEVERETGHYGEAQILLRAVESAGDYGLVAAIAAQSWVRRHPELAESLEDNLSWEVDGETPGPGLVQVALNRYRFEDGREAVVIERVHILPGTLLLEHREELEIRAEILELIGEWGRSMEIPVYLIRPETIRENMRWEGRTLKEKTIYRHYDKPVDREVWDSGDHTRLVLRGSSLTPERESKWFLYQGRGTAGSDAGLEEGERMTAAEFSGRYGVRTELFRSSGKATVEDLMGRLDAQAIVVDLPRFLYIYVQGKALFWKVDERLRGKSPQGGQFVILDLPREEWPGKVGLVFQDPMEDRIALEQIPFGLPVHDLRLEDVPNLDPFEVIAKIFRSRLGVPESQYLGGMVFLDAEGQAKLVLFSA